MELTAARLLGTFTRFPFIISSRNILRGNEPLRCKVKSLLSKSKVLAHKKLPNGGRPSGSFQSGGLVALRSVAGNHDEGESDDEEPEHEGE